jgi:hypothetical protein
MDCVIVPLPIDRQVLWRCVFKVFAPSMAFAHRVEARLLLFSRIAGTVTIRCRDSPQPQDAHDSILGLLVVLTVQILNVYKPRGLTARGRRRLAPTRAAAAGSSAPRHVEDTHAGR